MKGVTGMGVGSGGAGSQGAGPVQVRVDAVAALRSLVDAFHEDDLPSIKPLIPSLLNQLFALMAEVRSSPWTSHPPPIRSSLPVSWAEPASLHHSQPRNAVEHASPDLHFSFRVKIRLQIPPRGCIPKRVGWCVHRWRARMWCSRWRL